MRADINALAQHGASLGISSDPIRVAHAYHSHLEHFFAELHGSPAACISPTLTASPICTPAHDSMPLQVTAPPHRTSVHVSNNAALLSSTQSGFVPQRTLNRFHGVDPNGCDAPVGRPAKHPRLR